MKKNTEKKEKKIDIVFIILIAILVIMSITLIILKVINGKNIDTDSKEVKELYSYFNAEELTNCDGLFMYTDKKVSYGDLDNENKLCLAYHKLDLDKLESETYKPKKKEKVCNVDGMKFKADEDNNTCVVTKVPKEDINKLYHQVFGKDIEDNESFRISNFDICYLKDDNYYCGESETFTYVFGGDSTIYRTINRAVEKDNKIIIYDYFAKIANSICYSTYTENIQNTKCTTAYEKNNKVDYKFMKKYTIKYKHTYEKDADGTYHWVSSEPVTKIS